MRDKRKVLVTFSAELVRNYAATDHVTTVSRLRRAFRRRSELWQENFFYNLLNNGAAVDDQGVKYTLQKPPEK